MGVAIGRGETFLGIPLLKVRNLLQAWRYGGSSDPFDIASRKSVELDPRTVVVLLEELRERELLGPEEDNFGRQFDGLTNAGISLATANGKKAAPKVRAQRVLDQFLVACEAVNVRADLPFCVKEVWLFGSMIDEARATVGDIDLVLVTERTKQYVNHSLERYQELAVELGGENVLRSAGSLGPVRAVDYVESKLLHGERRHSLLSFGRLDELKSLGCPCQLVFFGDRGGRVSDPKLPRHPSSQGRANTARELRAMPDLLGSRGVGGVIPAKIVWPIALRVSSSPRWHIWGENDEFRARIAWDRDMHLVSAANDWPDNLKRNVVARRLNFQGVNGSSIVGVIAAERQPYDWTTRQRSPQYPTLGLVFERSLSEHHEGLRYTLRITSTAHRGKYPDYSDISAVMSVMLAVIGTDVERACRRDLEIGRERPISLDVQAPNDEVGETLLERLPAQFPWLLAQARARVSGEAPEVVL